MEAIDSPALRSLAAFHLTNGLVSVVGNILLMRFFVGQLRIPYFVANMLAIAMCGLANFVLADRGIWTSAADKRR